MGEQVRANSVRSSMYTLATRHCTPGGVRIAAPPLTINIALLTKDTSSSIGRWSRSTLQKSACQHPASCPANYQAEIDTTLCDRHHPAYQNTRPSRNPRYGCERKAARARRCLKAGILPGATFFRCSQAQGIVQTHHSKQECLSR